MKFEPVVYQNRIVGYSATENAFLKFFGNSFATEEVIAQLYPNLEMRRVKQVHGDKFVEASPSMIEADAHFSQNIFSSVAIVTADCLPVLISHPHFVCAIHAGWRGIEVEIINKCLSALIQRFGGAEELGVSIGPHIRKNNFEVSEDVAERLEAKFLNYSSVGKVRWPHASNKQKSYIDLELIARTQILKTGVTPQQVTSLKIDTLEDHTFASFRRTKSKTERNLSFVARLK